MVAWWGSGGLRAPGAAHLQQLEELRFRRGQRLAGEHLEEVAEVIAAVKRDPSHLHHAAAILHCGPAGAHCQMHRKAVSA